jgi:hypothetical protein
MLSDLSDPSKFAVSVSGSHTASGDTTYNSAALGLRYRPMDFLVITASFPYVNIKSKENVVYTDSSTGTLRYDTDGQGDISAMGWVNVAHLMLKMGEPPGAIEETGPEPLTGIGDPMLYLGAGVKFDNAPFDERDVDKYLYDRDKATFTGERSIADGVIPAYYQQGTGTTDFLMGLLYQQRFGRFTPSAALSFVDTGGRNDVGYERGNKFSWSAGTKYTFFRGEDCSQFYAQGGISGLKVVQDDYDHSEDTTALGSQPVGKVEDTKGTYNFYYLGLGYELGKQWSFIASAQFPLTNHNQDTDNSFDRQFGLSIQYRF